MKESSWNECLENNKSLEVTPNTLKSKSLINVGKARIGFIESNKITENNSTFIFEGYYNSAIEILHAITIKSGFKVTNHLCLGFYLRDILKRKDLFRLFDDFRYKRNSILYYGELIDFQTAKDSINKITKFIKIIQTMI